MKKFLAIFSTATVAALLFAACTKVDDLPYYENGNAVTLSSSKTAVAPTPADSLTNMIAFSWTNPEYASDANTFKYVLEIDSAGRNFAQKVSKIVTGSLTTSFTGKELNAMVLSYGFRLGVPFTLEARVVSSYGNNNERYTSNVITFAITPYTDPSVLTTANTAVSGTLATAGQLSNTF
ncbi:MAG: SusE domain-containing protein, partial [Chitinophagaceae bacterium]|nr:SusE domain-containing protein [Chitinophagaceae bacterium]